VESLKARGLTKHGMKFVDSVWARVARN
jgi:hypothetical protein